MDSLIVDDFVLHAIENTAESVVDVELSENCEWSVRQSDPESKVCESPSQSKTQRIIEVEDKHEDLTSSTSNGHKTKSVANTKKRSRTEFESQHIVDLTLSDSEEYTRLGSSSNPLNYFLTLLGNSGTSDTEDL